MKKLKDLKGFGLKTAESKQNNVCPTNPFFQFEKEGIRQSIGERFEKQITKYPDKVAVKAGPISITYDTLNRRSNCAAHAALEAYDDRYTLEPAEKARYSRQLMLHGWGIEAQEKLKSTTVFAAGAGGSGSPLIMQLALLGIGTIIICDYDDVDLSNLNRQVLHDEGRIGMNKALSAAQSIRSINPNVNVVTHNCKITAANIEEIVGDAAIIFDNVDDIEAKFVLSRCAVSRGIPHIISSMIDMDAYAAVFHPPHSACFHCLYDRDVLNELSEIKKYTESFKKNYHQLPNPVAAPPLFLATGFAVNEAVKILLGLDHVAYNKYFFFDQRGVEHIVDTEAYRKITYPFSTHFREMCKTQGFNWDEGKPGDFVRELTTAPNPTCPVCSRKVEAKAVSISAHSINGAGNETAASRKKHRLVALLFGQDIDMIAGLLGVLKAGMTYVPLDAAYPVERLVYMLKDSGARLMVTNSTNIALASAIRDKVNANIGIININDLPGTVSEENPGVEIEPTALAYILYTSGSTGKPKGVMQNHVNVLHFARVYANALHIHPWDKLTLFSSYSFDAAKMDIFGALLNGACLYPYDIKREGNLQQLPRWLRLEGITIYHSIPTVYRYFTDMLTNGRENSFPSIRFIVLGGEAVYKKDIDNYKIFFPDQCLFINGLGPTESTVTLQYFINKNTEITREAVPVGFPVDETQVYLLNEQNREAGVLGVGEIVFKSPYLAPGYWNLPRQTEKVFTPDPLTGRDRVYRTGDLGRRLPDGCIEYAGRKDFQVKVRGYRIEPGEIESKLDRLPDIKKSVVVCREDENHENFLAAYYTRTEEGKIDETELAAALKTSLPDYMIPSIFLSIPEFPFTPTGKIDRKELSSRDISQLLNPGEYQPPGNPLEEKMVQLWREILKPGNTIVFGVNENFFVLGGNSLKAVLLISLISKELHVEIALTEIFKHPTVRDMAAYVASTRKSAYREILPVEKREYYPLSSAQQRIFFLNHFEDVGTRFNIFVALSIKGFVEIEWYRSVLNALIERHETLRTSFHLTTDEPVQRIYPEIEFEIELPHEDHKRNLEAAVKDFVRPFNLSVAPLFRVLLLSISEKEHYFVFDAHHIIFDGTSMEVLVNDFIQLSSREEKEPLRIQYRDFAVWQNDLFRLGAIKEAEDFWLNLYADGLDGNVPRLDLPGDFPRPAVMSYEGDNFRFSLDENQSLELKRMALANNVSLFMLLLAIYNVFLGKLSHWEDIIVAAVLAGRNHADTAGLIGVFINMLPLRNQPAGDKNFIHFLSEVGENTTQAFENREYPFEALVEKLPGIRDISRHPLVDVGFTLQNTGISPDSPHSGDELPLRLVSLKSMRKDARNDLNLEGFEINNCLDFEFQYRTKLFKRETIERFVEYFSTLISEIICNPNREIRNIDLLSEADRELLLVRLNETEKTFAGEKTIFQLFEEQVQRVPEKTAVRSTIELQNIYDQLKAEDVEVDMSYEELNERANRLAHLLRSQGVGPDVVVGLIVQHPLEKVVGIWGIMKSGGAYLPVDPLYPGSVIRDIFHDSHVPVTVTETGFSGMIGEINPDMPLVFIDDTETIYGSDNPGFIPGMSNLAYIIYTSGTTGKAKGTAVEHRGIANYARWRTEYFDFSEEDVTLQPLTYSFDSFCANFYPSFLCGGELVMVPDNRRLDFDYILHAVREYGVTTICFAPGLCNVLLNSAGEGDLESLRLIVLAGEAATPALIRKSREKIPHTRLANEYGPTEGTVAATTHPEITEETTAIIGTPIANAAVYILDEWMNPVLPGVTGEIFIGGTGVARGYLNHPELTEEKFCLRRPGTFLKKGSWTSKNFCLYKTGDLGRRLLNGTIEFLGRKDFQVKIRGHRIELEQIESLLTGHPLVKEVLVNAAGEGESKYICAYIVPGQSGEFNPAPLKEYLRDRLPYYMMPSYFVALEKMPLTSNGKINRKALPRPETGKTGEEYVAPSTALEKQIADALKEVLHIEKVGIYDNFFEIGGNSLNLVQVNGKLKELTNREIPVVTIFQFPTIHSLSEHLSGETTRVENRQEELKRKGDAMAEAIGLFDNL
jgi:amino acid adenylation domain-containing protein